MHELDARLLPREIEKISDFRYPLDSASKTPAERAFRKRLGTVHIEDPTLEAWRRPRASLFFLSNTAAPLSSHRISLLLSGQTALSFLNLIPTAHGRRSGAVRMVAFQHSPWTLAHWR